MFDKKIDYNALAQAADTTFGRSSTPKTASYSTKVSFLGPDRVLVSYQAVVNFATERQMIDMKRTYSEESQRIVAEVMKQLKAKYKELTGDTLNSKESNSNDSIEIIGQNVNNPRRTAYYRRKTIFDLA